MRSVLVRSVLMYVKYIANPRPNSYSGLGFHVDYSKDKDEPIELRMALPTGVYDYVARLTWQEWEKINAWLRQQLLQ